MLFFSFIYAYIFFKKGHPEFKRNNNYCIVFPKKANFQNFQTVLFIMTTTTENPQDQVQQYQDCLDVVEAHLKLLTQKPLEETLAGLSEIERAKFKTTLAYSISTLQLCYLRTKGEDIQDHKNRAHLDRLRSYFNQINNSIDLPQN